MKNGTHFIKDIIKHCTTVADAQTGEAVAEYKLDAKASVPKLDILDNVSDSCDVVFLLTHFRTAEDEEWFQEIRKKYPKVKAMLASHDHNPSLFEAGATPEEKQIMIKAGMDGHYVAVVDVGIPKSKATPQLWFNGGSKPLGTAPGMVAVVDEKQWRPKGDNPRWTRLTNAMTHTIDRLEAPYYDQVLAKGWTGTYDTMNVRSKETNTFNFILKMWHDFHTYGPNETNEDDMFVTMLNTGNVRGSRFAKEFPTTERFTEYHVMSELPFPDPVNVYELPARDLLLAAAMGPLNRGEGMFVQWHNLKMLVGADNNLVVDQNGTVNVLVGGDDPEHKWVAPSGTIKLVSTNFLVIDFLLPMVNAMGPLFQEPVGSEWKKAEWKKVSDGPMNSDIVKCMVSHLYGNRSSINGLVHPDGTNLAPTSHESMTSDVIVQPVVQPDATQDASTNSSLKPESYIVDSGVVPDDRIEASTSSMCINPERKVQCGKEWDPSLRNSTLLDNASLVEGTSENGSTAEGSSAEGSAAEGSSSEGSTADGSSAEESSAEGSSSEGSAAEGSAAERMREDFASSFPLLQLMDPSVAMAIAETDLDSPQQPSELAKILGSPNHPKSKTSAKGLEKTKKAARACWDLLMVTSKSSTQGVQSS
jgi:hypothetical protein